MKTAIYVLSASLLLNACNKPNKKLIERVGNSDSVAINYFKGDGTADTVVAVKIVRDKKTIENLSTLIAANSTTAKGTCGYDGSIHFFKNNNVTQDINFRMNDAGCMYFTFKQEGRLAATVLSPQAKHLLETIKGKL